jgi:hypothetical protein
MIYKKLKIVELPTLYNMLNLRLYEDFECFCLKRCHHIFATIGGILIPATAQPTDNSQTEPVLKSLIEGNLTSNVGSNRSNVTTPAEYR